MRTRSNSLPSGGHKIKTVSTATVRSPEHSPNIALDDRGHLPTLAADAPHKIICRRVASVAPGNTKRERVISTVAA